MQLHFFVNSALAFHLQQCNYICFSTMQLHFLEMQLYFGLNNAIALYAQIPALILLVKRGLLRPQAGAVQTFLFFF